MQSKNSSYELQVLVGGRAITEYDHEGYVFTEGRKGSDFEVLFKNKTNGRVLVVPAVDGKSVLDGKPATPDSLGYIVPAWGSLKIPGWTLNGNEVAKFTFDDKDKSYASQTSTGEVVQSGVIGVLVYGEKLPPKPIEHHHHHYPKTPAPPYQPWFPTSPNPTWMNNAVGSPRTAAEVKSAMVNRSMMASSSTSNIADVAGSVNTVSKDSVVADQVSSATPFEMGTGFGERMDFKVTQTTFDRAELVAQMVIYYDSRRNLEKRGIQITRRESYRATDLPQAFTGLGCQPPSGWKG